MGHFSLAHLLQDNPSGWGPVSEPDAGQPFAPYSKNERSLGRIADFSAQAQARGFQGRYRDREPAPGTAVLNFEKAEEDEAFQLVDKPVVKKPVGGPPRRQQGGRGAWGQQAGGREEPGGRGGRGGQQQGGAGGRGGGPWGQQQQRRPPWWRDQPRVQYSSSVEIKPEWLVLGDQISFPPLTKVLAKPGAVVELTSAGALSFYDKAADRVGPKNPAKLRKTGVRTRSSTASEDPILRRLAAEDAGDVFFTDDVLSTIMCATRSVYPWDIVITKKGDQLWFDKRPNSSLDFLTNGETAPEPLEEKEADVNGVRQLSFESTAVNQAFKEQVLAASAEKLQFKEGLPEGRVAQAGYKFFKVELGDYDLVVRSQVDAAIKLGDATQLVAIHALNEFDPKWSGVDWRQKLENQRGAVLATELKNNANKIAKWTASALVGGIDLIKLGYLSRNLPRDNQNHVILGTQAVKPRDFAAQINLNMDNCWGVVKALLELCFKEMSADGKYLLVRDPNKPQLRLYQVPSEALEQPSGLEAGAGDEEGEGEGEGADGAGDADE